MPELATPVAVSVVIPAYNAAAQIENAIDSVLAQSMPPMEIIVVDDGSTDDTAKLVARRYPQIILIRQENQGCGPARNTGCRIARGEWLAFLDADDEWLPEKLEKQLTRTRDPEVAVISARATTKDGIGLGTEIAFTTLWHRNVLIVSSTLVRRAAFEAAGGFWTERYCEDYHLWLRLAGAGWKIANCSQDLVLYRPTEDSLSRQTERFAEIERLCLVDAARHLGTPRSKLERRLLDSYLVHARGALVQRRMALARRLLCGSMAHGIRLEQLALLAGTALPPCAFAARRQLLHWWRGHGHWALARGQQRP
jgi:glycosyltransferase involved in cell wall biosynthesis